MTRDLTNRSYDQMTHDEILQEHARRYASMSAAERQQQSQTRGEQVAALAATQNQGREAVAGGTKNSNTRKLAREAVVFMLLTGVLLAVVVGYATNDRASLIFIAPVCLGIGFVAGLAIWGLYRMVRFAITG
jgi:hypothetical protein